MVNALPFIAALFYCSSSLFPSASFTPSSIHTKLFLKGRSIICDLKRPQSSVQISVHSHENSLISLRATQPFMMLSNTTALTTKTYHDGKYFILTIKTHTQTEHIFTGKIIHRGLHQEIHFHTKNTPSPVHKPTPTDTLSTPRTANKPMIDTKPTIVIDAGHGGSDYGSVVNGIAEKDICLSVALFLKKKLIQTHKFNVVLTRTSDVTVSKAHRLHTVLSHYPSCYITLHTSQNPNSELRGAVVYHNKSAHKTTPWEHRSLIDDQSERLGHLMLGHLKQLTLVYHNIPSALSIREFEQLPCPSLHLSLGHTSHVHERTILQDKAYQAALADSICSALTEYAYFL
ncbi:MAG: N-acetylmuramoyl-L-alanine amidase [Alphaproteobacteria bacterium]|nr:N-acetylmuramoyl-L-alanine amidase [Alphaproteobacteria bacterium]